jgi:hypothetical protein
MYLDPQVGLQGTWERDNLCLVTLFIPCPILDDGLKEVLKQPMFDNLCIPYLALDELVVKMQIGN